MKRNISIVLLAALLSFAIYSAAKVNFTILGVIASSNKDGGIALVKNKETGKVSAYKAGTKIDSKTLIEKIERKTVTFVMDEKTYTMRVGDDNPTESVTREDSSVASNLNNANGIERVGNRLRISRELKENLVGKNLNKILMQAAAVPYTKNGRLIGFKLLEIASIFSRGSSKCIIFW